LALWCFLSDKKTTPQLCSKQTICHIIGMAHITSNAANAIISRTMFLLNPDNFIIYHFYYDYVRNHMYHLKVPKRCHTYCPKITSKQTRNWV